MSEAPKRSFPVGPTMLVAFGLAAGAVSYYGTRPGVAPAGPGGGPPTADAGPVVSIALPVHDPDLPPGPHQEALRTSCVACHSTQLILNQPHLPEKKWAETVKKMVHDYGAPVPEGRQKDVLEYLVAIRGKE